MNKIILVRYEEIFLKGLNKPMFERQLINNIKQALYSIGEFKVTKTQGRIFVIPNEDADESLFENAMERLTKVFGVASISPVYEINTDFELIKQTAADLTKELLNKYGYKTFKVESKRADKRFPIKSPEISREVGASILKGNTTLSVDVHNPDFVFYVEVRENTYLYTESIRCSGGLPVGTSGKSILLLSGGIDSPVAGWMVAKRGVQIHAVHFYSYPYTSERSKDKVIKLAKIISPYTKRFKLYIVPFTEPQLEINEKCPQDHLTIIMRRIMMKIAQRIAEKEGAASLITGESIGQVASQTMEALHVTNSSVDIPVFRPLIGMDKYEVINVSKKIDTYETSILPYEDCCTVFVAKHPKTKPKLKETIEYESVLDVDKIVKECVENAEIIVIK